MNLHGEVAGAVGLVLIGISVALAIYAVLSLIGKSNEGLANFLQPYTEGFYGDEEEDDSALAQTALLKRAVAVTEGLAKRRGLLTKVEDKLERADLPLRGGEALFFFMAWATVVTVLGLLLGQFMGLLFGALIGFLLPFAVLGYLGKRRQKAFVMTLPDMLSLLAGSMRAGYSLMQGVEAVSQEISEPMGKELRRVVTESRLGRDLEESLDGVAERMNSADFAWAVVAIRIQREVGGNLAELLLTVGETMTQREQLRRDVATLTAEGKISAIVIGLLPVGLGGAMYAMNPGYMGVLFSDPLGQMMAGAATVGALIGFAWMKKTIRIEV